MKKNILLSLMPLLFFWAADAQETSLLFFQEADAPAQEECHKDCHKGCVDETNFYAKIFSGPNFLQSTTIDNNNCSYKTGYIVAGSLGYCWPCGLRLEAEYAYRRNAISKIHFFGQGSSDHGHFKASSLMANLSAWGCTFWNIKPFIGAGIGCDFQQMHSSNSRIVFNQNWTKFSWQLMTGLAFPIFCNTELTLEYKFHQGGSFYNHSVGLGLIYKFGYLK